MVLVKILKRRDASSVLVAIVLATIVGQSLMSTTMQLAAKISGTDKGPYGMFGPGSDWKSQYLFPVVWTLLQIVIFEIICWIVVLANRPLARRKK